MTVFRNNVLTTRRETTDIWESKNIILDDMELGVEIILNQDRTVSHYNIKLGNGITQWNSLDYFYENLNEEDTNEILDDFTINLATRKPVANRIPIYDDDSGLKSGKEPTEDEDVVRLKDLNGITIDVGQLEQDISDLTDSFDTHKTNTSAHGATATPTADKIAMYNSDSGLKSGKVPTENNDVIRFLEFNNEISDINSKISTLNGAYYVLDAYNFGKELDVTNPDDVIILNTYAIANTPDAGSMTDVYNDTVIVNEFDSAEYVYNKIAGVWVKYPNGYLTIATNDHLGVVKGTQPPADPADESRDTYVQVLADGAMKLVGDRLGKVNTVDSVAPGTDKDIELTVAMTKAEHDALEDPIGSGKYPSLAGKTVTLTDVYPKNIRRIPFSDTSKQEAANRISAVNNSSWTVDKTGYVYLFAYNNSATVINGGLNISINGKTRVATAGAFAGDSGVFEVTSGDVVKVSLGTGGTPTATCNFIPIKWVDVEEN
jgi:hypothetical protein